MTPPGQATARFLLVKSPRHGYPGTCANAAPLPSWLTTMDNNDNKRPRNTRDISTHIDEKDLWDLGDDWADDDSEPASAAQPEEETADSGKVQDPPTEETAPEETAAEVSDTGKEPAGQAEDHDGTDGDPGEDEREEEDAPTPGPEEQADTEPGSTGEKTDAVPEVSLQQPEQPEDAPEEDAPAAEATSGDGEAPAGPGGITAPATAALEKLSLNKAEKTALGALAALLVGLAIWGIVWLGQKNAIANARESVELPVEGEYATITGLSTAWVTPTKEAGVHLDAVVVPSASITLDPDKTDTGALRLFFKNADGVSVGDPITLPFKGGEFANGSSTIEVSASDGFHEEGQFFGYQTEDAKPWRILILEAPSAASPGSEFTEIIDAPVGAKRK